MNRSLRYVFGTTVPVRPAYLQLQFHLTWIVQPFAPPPLRRLHHYYGFCWLLTVRCYYGCSACETSRDKSSIFPRLPVWFTHMSYVCLLDFIASSRLIHHMSLGIRFLSVRLRFRYCFFSPVPHNTNLASRSGVRWQLRPLWTFTTDWRHARHTRKTACLHICR